MIHLLKEDGGSGPTYMVKIYKCLRITRRFLLKRLDQNQKNEIEDYYTKYLNFKTNELDPWLENLNKKSKPFYFSLKNTINFIKSLKENLSNKNSKYNLERDPNIPYILFLLPKPNHWSTSYINPGLLDQVNIVSEVLSRIPNGFNIVIKTHPKAGESNSLKRLVASYSNCYLEKQYNTDELVNDSAMVIFYGTTSGVEALMHNKHVIEIGKNTLFFDIEDPPVKRLLKYQIYRKLLINVSTNHLLKNK